MFDVLGEYAAVAKVVDGYLHDIIEGQAGPMVQHLAMPEDAIREGLQQQADAFVGALLDSIREALQQDEMEPEMSDELRIIVVVFQTLKMAALLNASLAETSMLGCRMMDILAPEMSREMSREMAPSEILGTAIKTQAQKLEMSLSTAAKTALEQYAKGL